MQNNNHEGIDIKPDQRLPKDKWRLSYDGLNVCFQKIGLQQGTVFVLRSWLCLNVLATSQRPLRGFEVSATSIPSGALGGGSIVSFSVLPAATISKKQTRTGLQGTFIDSLAIFVSDQFNGGSSQRRQFQLAVSGG